MDDMEQKLSSILGNPQMMSQLMSMAQSLTQPQQQPEEPKKEPENIKRAMNEPKLPQAVTGFDLNMLQRVAGLAQQAGIDRNQQALLKALGPYLSRGRITKLEKAMRAAKIAGLATTVLGSGGSIFQSGR